MPILILPVSLLCRSNVPVRHRLDCPSSGGRRLFQPIPAACKSSIQEAFCRTLLKLFLIGSAVSVATLTLSGLLRKVNRLALAHAPAKWTPVRRQEHTPF